MQEREGQDPPGAGEAAAEIDRWIPLVHRILRKYRSSVRPSDREDLLQVGYLGLWIGLRTYRPGLRTKLTTWIWVTVNREVMDYLRAVGPVRRRGSPRVLPRALSFSEVPPQVLERALSRYGHQEETAERNEFWADVKMALASFPRWYEILRMKYATGRRQEEIARSLGICEGRVSQLLTKARRKLRSAFR